MFCWIDVHKLATLNLAPQSNFSLWFEEYVSSRWLVDPHIMPISRQFELYKPSKYRMDVITGCHGLSRSVTLFSVNDYKSSSKFTYCHGPSRSVTVPGFYEIRITRLVMEIMTPQRPTVNLLFWFPWDPYMECLPYWSLFIKHIGKHTIYGSYGYSTPLKILTSN